ncbi:MAG: hypothetical protein PWQ29_932 [Verrucomicrobiota bacterium]|jgi:hypothetical protein|nr:hypothetical protein [Verrucomicrobiota bacterium]MDK2963538.1 hypothetical protein [Verrucomicrobiota bacterium]
MSNNIETFENLESREVPDQLIPARDETIISTEMLAEGREMVHAVNLLTGCRNYLKRASKTDNE